MIWIIVLFFCAAICIFAEDKEFEANSFSSAKMHSKSPWYNFNGVPWLDKKEDNLKLQAHERQQTPCVILALYVNIQLFLASFVYTVASFCCIVVTRTHQFLCLWSKEWIDTNDKGCGGAEDL